MHRIHSATFAVIAGLIAGIGTWAAAIDVALAPEPAKTTAPLTGTTGATAQAVSLTIDTNVKVVKWPSSMSYCGPNMQAGMLCSNIDLASDEVPYKRIQKIGSNCRCYGTYTPVVEGELRKPRLITSMIGNEFGTAVLASSKAVTVIKWPNTYHVEFPLPEPGTACSPVDLPVGATITRHIQVFQEGSGWRRCVSNTLPIYAQ